jgi:hypothetical protein
LVRGRIRRRPPKNLASGSAEVATDLDEFCETTTDIPKFLRGS